ncbi:MAG: glutamate--tRNA ligase [Ponticaulis sp.]|nr:glutamate--tRNA ligase [Ponticaulis sp.]
MTVTTRFAPSPTGFLHIGGARTALFNWLFAKHHGGRFLLRIEDTDLKRSTQEAIDAILEGMEWLGLTSDEPPIFQSQRKDRHIDVANDLVARGKAYKCYVTPEELTERREKGQELRVLAKEKQAAGQPFETEKAEADKLLAPFRSPYRDGKAAPSEDMPFVVRLRAPDDGKIALQDKVQGTVELSATEIDDLILLRADGTPTYMLAVVVDDHDMGVTQVIRGDDHLTNTFRQIPIFQGMDWDIPSYAHIPLIHGPDGAKLSKRHGALGIEAYRDMGYLPDGLKNYLLRLGWSHGDDEVITTEQAIDWFDLDSVNKGASRMDFEKLAFINGEHIKTTPNETLSELVIAQIETNRSLAQAEKARISLAMGDLKLRGRTIPELSAASEFLIVNRPIDISAKARKKLSSDALKTLGDFREILIHIETWTSESLAKLIEDFCQAKNIGMGKIGPQLRTALTGGLPAPDLNLVLFWLGQDESLARIDDVLNDDTLINA